MRYRRYITQRNPNGSRTVVSVGPVYDGFGWMLKGFFRFTAVFTALLWPAIAVNVNLRGTVAWVVGVPCELIWLGFCALCVRSWRQVRPKPQR